MRLLTRPPAREGTGLAALQTSSSWPRVKPGREAGCSLPGFLLAPWALGEVPKLPAGPHHGQSSPGATVSPNSASRPILVFWRWGWCSHLHLGQRRIQLGGMRLNTGHFVGVEAGAL